MKAFLKKPLLSVSSCVVILAISFVAYQTGFAADTKRPQRGSVHFGASEAPKINTSPQFEAFRSVFADVAEKVVPTVVSVIPTKIDTIVYSSNPFSQLFTDPFGDPMEEFFGNSRNRRAPPVEKKEHRQHGLGSGVIVSKDGYILTNFHVVAGADEIDVKTTDGRQFEADVVGSDSLADIAVIKIREKVQNLPTAYLGDSDKLRPGDWSVAIGNPFSLTSSVTMGIVSAIGRETPGGSSAQYQNYIQTDAAINPGNSGGALVNLNGELIGINTLIYTQSGGYMGIGFAIPINMAKRIMEDLIYEGKVSRGWLGVSIQPLDPETRSAFNITPETKGVLIGDVTKGQPADKAGIKRGDIVININGKPVETPNQLKNMIAALHPGEGASIDLLRNSKKVTVQVKLVSRDAKFTSLNNSANPKDEDQLSESSDKLGIKVGAISEDVRKQLNYNDELKGVIVTEVNDNSPAADVIRENDIILEVNRQAVESVKDFKQALKSVKSGDSVLLLILRDDITFFKAFKIK